MWRVALCLTVLLVALPAVSYATRAPMGALSVEGGKGLVIVRGNGGLLGRLARGTVEFVDFTPNDQWQPIVNGVARGRRTYLRGTNLSFRILGGDYRVGVKGDGISISARGSGVVTLLGMPGPTGDTGLYAAGVNADCQGSPDQCLALPASITRVSFGQPETTVPPATP
jgi:hypothetical protein